MLNLSKKKQASVIFAVTIGNILEWYEIYLYIFWAPVIARLFFSANSDLVNISKALAIFGIGFLARPIGGVLFGRLGDRVGRKKALVLSITVMTLPTFLMGLLPTYAQIGIYAPLLLVILRLMQSFPAGGELPGAFCFLYESSNYNNRRYMTSWGAVGNQIGIIISMYECYLLEKYLTPEELVTWGWRISFLVGGLIGLSGFYLRYKLHETPLFIEAERHKQVTKKPVFSIFYKYKKALLMGSLFCIFDSAAFYLISSLFPIYFGRLLGTSPSDNLIITILLLILNTIPLPLFGILGDKFSNKKMLIYSSIGVIVLLLPLYIGVSNSSLSLVIAIAVVFSILFACISALIPYLLSSLYPTPVRFTCLGFTFNMVDSVVGGFTPIVALYLLKYTGNEASFCWVLLVTALISMCSYFVIRDRKATDVNQSPIDN